MAVLSSRAQRGTWAGGSARRPCPLVPRYARDDTWEVSCAVSAISSQPLSREDGEGSPVRSMGGKCNRRSRRRAEWRRGRWGRQCAKTSRRKHFGECGQKSLPCRDWDCAEPLHQPCSIDCSELVEDDPSKRRITTSTPPRQRW